MIQHAKVLWPFFALMQPIGAAVFALDGILIGASDTRFLKWTMVAAFACFGPRPSILTKRSRSPVEARFILSENY